MNTGKMRHKIKILNKKDDSVFHECNAAIKDLFGKEKYEAMAQKVENSVKLEIRYLPKLKELRRYRVFKVIFDNEEYKIIDVDFNNGRKDKIVIQAQYVE